MQDAIRYKGNLGSLAANDFGSWETGQTRDVGDAHGQVPANAAAMLVSHGCFEFVDAEPAPKKTKDSQTAKGN